MPRKAKRPLCDEHPSWESPLPARHGPPTLALPRTEDKMKVLEERARRRESLFQPGDLVDSEKIRRRLKRAGNNTDVVDEDDPIIDDRNSEEKESGEGLTKLTGYTPADRIREARLAKGLSAREASVKMGLDPSMVGRIERREIAPSLWMIYLVSQHLDVSPDWVACIYVDPFGIIRYLLA